MSIICSVFPLLLLSSSSPHIPSDRASLPGPSASHVLKIDFSIVLVISSSHSGLCLTQLLASELPDGLLPLYFLFISFLL